MRTRWLPTGNVDRRKKALRAQVTVLTLMRSPSDYHEPTFHERTNARARYSRIKQVAADNAYRLPHENTYDNKRELVEDRNRHTKGPMGILIEYLIKYT